MGVEAVELALQGDVVDELGGDVGDAAPVFDGDVGRGDRAMARR
jgi:hypothetical protein